MNETRHAILIGMNSYKMNPLSYSVKDVNDVREVLVNYCRFEPGHITLVEDSTLPVIQQIENAFKSLQKQFRAGADLFLFYYSGHGEYNKEEEKSLLSFEDDTTLAIGDIVMNYVEPLRAKNNYLIIDACNSGKNVYIKPKYSHRKMERKLLNDSKELYFLFAAEENKKAYQNDKLKNSYYTHYFVEAIKNEKLYDEDGWLTMNSIDEYIRKKISNHKDIIQIPGSEARTTGYKPFAFFERKTIKIKTEQVIIKKETMNNDKHPFDLRESLTSENRKKIQEQLALLLETIVEDYPFGELSTNYDIRKRSRNEAISYEIEESLEKNIIKTAEAKDLEAINETFRVKLLPNNRQKTGLSAMFDMIHGEPKPEYSYNIIYNGNYIVSAFIELKSKSYENVSGGLYCLFYQAKYGFVFCKTFFKYRWDGTDEKMSKFVTVNLTPYRLIEENVTEAKKELTAAFNELIQNIKKWNEERKKEIADFLKKAK